MKQKVLHYPRLDTVMMVENTIKNAPDYLNKRQLWMALPKKMMYQTLLVILDYLEKNSRIHFCKDGKIIWTWDPEGIKKILATGVKLR